jgi:helicase
MKIKETLAQYHFPQEFIEIITSSGKFTDFYPPQAEAIEKGALKGQSLLLAVPTASGKTLIAELCMLRAILQDQGRCLYIAPLKALASEKFNEFKKKYEGLGIKVGIATGDLDSPNKFLNRYQILIATAEKVDSLLRSRAKWLIDGLSVVVLDEIHFINDGSRGPTMEILTARIKQLNTKAQILALSATVQNANEMAGWLNAKFVTTTWRPIPLKEGVYYNEKIKFDNGGIRLIREEDPDDLSKLTMDTLRGKGQVLVFVNSRRSAEAASRQISRSVASVSSPEDKEQLKVIAKQILGTDPTKVCRKLSEVVLCGAAFHHAGLRPRQRELIEENFKKNLIKAICSTPTLAAGVNLPARRAIIRDCKRFESGLGSVYIPASEYKQCAGRAGRPQYDDHGEAILIAKSFSESSALFERYIHADPEPVISKLGEESALRMHVLASVAGGYVHDINGMLEFISHTFLAHQKQTGHLIELISDIFDFLNKENFIEKSGFRYYATAFGQCTSRLYIDPLSAITLRDGLKKVHEGRRPATAAGILHLLCCCPDSPRLNVGKNDYAELEEFASHYHDEMIVTQDDISLFEDFYFYLSTLKTAWMLLSWIDEEKEDAICERFGVGPGDVYRHTESSEWLLHAAGVMAELFKYRMLTFTIENLRQRIKYGIQEELLELAQLRGVGRVRARSLFRKGYKRLADLRHSSLDDLSGVPQIGKSLAGDIHKQLSRIKKHTVEHKRTSAQSTSNE